MFKNYLKIAIRNLFKQKLYSFIHIFGLSVGIACCVLIFLFVRNELFYDTFHENKDRLYRVNAARVLSDGGTRVSPYVPMPFGPTLQAEYPEVEAAVRFQNRNAVIRSGDNLLRENVIFTDPAFFSAFSFDQVSGVPVPSWLKGNSIVLSQSMSEKYFPELNPVGQVIYLRLNEQELDFVVSGVLKNAPENSTIQYDFLVNFERLSELSSGARERANLWNSHNSNVFVLLKTAENQEHLLRKLPAFAEKYYENPRELSLQPITEIHLTPEISSLVFGNVSDPLYSYILAGIAGIVLLIACINFMTIAIGRSTSRIGEVGTRKVMGADRLQLMMQFWGEALLMSFLALIVGITLAELFLPTFNLLIEKNLSLNPFSDGVTFGALLSLILVVGLIAGSYPALLMSNFQPIEIFRKRVRLGGSAMFGRVMVILQFSLSIFLIIMTIIMGRQQEYLMTKNLGFNQEQVLIIPTVRAAEGERLLQVFQDELTSESRVLSVSGAAFSFDRGSHLVGFNYQEMEKHSYEYRVDYNYLSLLGLELVQGRDFSKKHATDPDRAAIVNETFIKMLEWQNPIGETFMFRGRNLSVIGVVNDYHYRSLHNAIEPVVLHLDPAAPIRYLLVRIQAQDIPGTIELLKEKWRQVAPAVPFEYYFLDNDVGRQYRAEQRWDRIVTYSSVFAIIIACLGLFGLSSLSVSQRTKEIGIRKVLGATVPGLVGLVNKEFLTLVVLGNLIAWPSAYFVMSKWLEGFAYRIELGLTSFALAAVTGLIIALITVSYQSIKTALANPVEALRYE